MRSAQLLHITDLHLAADPKWDQVQLKKKLLEDLRGLGTRGQKPDLVLFSGDLAQAAGPSSYAACVEYLEDVGKAASVKPDRFVVCPGNHDIDRGVAGPRIPEIKEWRSRAASTTGANDLSVDATFTQYVETAFRHFTEATNPFAGKGNTFSDPYLTAQARPELGLNVVSLNTATLSGGGLSSDVSDRGNLFLPERSLVLAIESLPSDHRTVFVGHHPVSWMNEDNAALVAKIITAHGAAYFFGHMHEAMPAQTRLWSGEALFSQSGALYMGRPYWNGYAIAAFHENSNHSRISYRRWWEPRRSFSKAEDLGDDGTFYSSDEAKTHWTTNISGPDTAALESWRNTQLLPELERECNSSFSEQDLDAVFVEPEFDHEVPYGQEADGRVGSRIELLSLHQIITSDKNYVVSSGPETGKSSLLKHIALEYGRRSVKSADWTFPVIVSFSDFRPYQNSIERAIRQKLPDLPSGLTTAGILKSGSMVILVDDVDFSKNAPRDTLIEFVNTYSGCRFIFASSTPFMETSALRPQISEEVPFTRVRMRPISPEKMRTLIESHGTIDPLEADKMLARVIRDSEALNVPLTPVTGTFLIQIFKDDPDQVLVNQAALTERYIEMVLQKFAPREVLPGTFDFKNKLDLLSTISERMARESDYSPEYNTILTWVVEYLAHYGLNFPANDILTYFIESRVLEHGGTGVRFRLRMFYEFFAASRMIDDATFREYVLSPERYLQFINEIGFYAALNRKDGELVRRIYETLAALGESNWEEGKVPDPESFLSKFQVPGRSTTEDELDDIYRSVRTREALELDRGRLRDGIELLSNSPDQVVSRLLYETVSEQWFAHLILLSTLVKHTELIPDADKKAYLAGALDGWVQFAANMLGIVNPLAKERRIRLNGVTYVSTLPETLPIGEVARRLALSMPAAAGKMATTFMGTEKLIPQIEEGIGVAGEPFARQLMRFSILADLGSEDVAQLASRLADVFTDKRFLSHALARKLYEVAVRFRLPKPVLNRVRTVAADIYVSLEGVEHKKIASRRAKIIEGMATQRRQIEFVRDHSVARPATGDALALIDARKKRRRKRKSRRG